MDHAKRISKAKSSLILEHPFWGTLAMNLPIELSEDVPTAATNGQWIKFNPNFLDTLNDDEVVFVIAHEIGHPMFEHMGRLKGRDPLLWNVAGDIVINEILTDDKVGSRPDGVLYEPDYYEKGDGVTDKIYRLLQQEQEQGGDGDGPGGGGFTLEGDVQPDESMTDAEREAQAKEWKVKVSQAARAAKMMGNLSANMERLVGELLESKVNWREVLQQFITKIKDDQRTWSRGNRRMAVNGVYLPGRDGETLGELVFAFDTSGSISFGADGEGTQFASEVLTVKQDHNPSVIHIMYFDSSVTGHDTFTRDDEVVINPRGGGGTAFSPVFRKIEEEGIEPEAIIFLTDLCCNDFGNDPGVPVLWCSTHSSEAPFGQVVMM